MMRTPENYVLTVGLSAMQGRWNTRWPELMAGSLMSMAPIILLLILFQRYVEEGLSFTGMKPDEIKIASASRFPNALPVVFGSSTAIGHSVYAGVRRNCFHNM